MIVRPASAADLVAIQSIYAQHVLASGAVDGAWPAGGRALCTAVSHQQIPTVVPDGLGDPAFDEAIAADGTPSEIRARLHRAQDEAAAGLIDLSVDELGYGARWSGMPVTVAFRQARWSSHLIEHIVQVDKTLVWLGRQPSEVERLVRLVAGAWGRLEEAIWPRPANDEGLALAVEAARRAAETAASVRAAAGAAA